MSHILFESVVAVAIVLGLYFGRKRIWPGGGGPFPEGPQGQKLKTAQYIALLSIAPFPSALLYQAGWIPKAAWGPLVIAWLATVLILAWRRWKETARGR